MGQLRFTDEEVRRYARQMVLPEVGGIGQARLRNASATAESELEALYLAAAGVGTVYVPNDEIVRAVQAVNPLVLVVVDPKRVAPPPVHAAQEACERALATLKELLSL
jgi:molybdopterin/thiamine biosynthesis adenylyltransferase